MGQLSAIQDHWDLIEGQGSLFHVSYSGVTMALIHGGQPDALILCHEPTRKHMRGLPEYSLPSLKNLNDTALHLAKVANPDCKVIGISVNTQFKGSGSCDVGNSGNSLASIGPNNALTIR